MLSLCATPIGNLKDITRRVVEAFTACDVVYCEDTRHTLQLLNHLDIKKPLVSCHQHNEKQRAEEVVALLREGKEVVYASDAGMPGVSDPGQALVAACIRENLPYTVLPGASAVLTAAVMSGFCPTPFSFYGFLPRENKPAKAMLEEISRLKHLVLLYESPQRVQKTLSLLLDALGDWDCAVLRELTKKFEEVKRGSISGLIPLYETPPKGECVIALYPNEQTKETPPEALDGLLSAALEDGLSVRDAAAFAAEKLGVSKKEAYSRALFLQKG